VWRRLRGAGAIYLQNSVAALPATPAAERLLRGLRKEIVGEMSGQAQVLRATALDGEAEIVAAFKAARNDEYEEIIDRCKDFLAEIEGNTKTEHFTYGELEENDEDLNKLRGWHAKVVGRDAFSASGAKETAEALEACTKALDDFAARVYEADHG
jgi:hypothetical protein